MSTANQTTETLIINRDFNAPVDRVWKAFTTPDVMKKWWGPRTYTCPVCQIDFRVGGKYLSCMKSSEGQEFWGTGVYKEIIPFKKIVCTDSFADEKGNVVNASYYKMPGDWPDQLLVTFKFEENDGTTRLTLRHEGLPEEIVDPCRDGWNESFDKLSELLAG